MNLTTQYRMNRLRKAYPEFSEEQLKSMCDGFDNKPTRMQLDLTDLNTMADLLMPVDSLHGVRRNMLDVYIDPTTDVSIKKMLEENLQQMSAADASELSDADMLAMLPSRYIQPGQEDVYLNYIHQYVSKMQESANLEQQAAAQAAQAAQPAQSAQSAQAAHQVTTPKTE